MAETFTSARLDAFFRGFLDIEGFAGCDDSLNGIQVDNDGCGIGKIAFAVDANMETIERAADCGAGMLFVHHGLFWGKPSALRGWHRARIKTLLDRNLCLYAVHLPLDQHPEMGNNAVMARLLGLRDVAPFGSYHGKKLGYRGTLPEPTDIGVAAAKIGFESRPPLGIFPFGKKENLTCAIVSGGAAMNAFEAIGEGIDLFISGEMSHSVYGACMEGGLNMIAAGHYSSEVWGVRAVMGHCAETLGIDVEFIDVPTGL